MCPKISVIVPAYNAEKYLYRCVDSVLKQTFFDFELLLVDDGSTDGTAAICDTYSSMDSRVRVFHKENGGVSSARNLGIDNAQGEWITFVDSDDWIEYNAFEKFIDYNDGDLIVGAMKFENSQTIAVLSEENTLIEGDTLWQQLTGNIDHSLISGPWCKLFKRKIIVEKQIRFNEALCFAEDNVFVKSYLIHISRIRNVNVLCYHYQDIGDDIYVKYSKSFIPILNYFYEILKVYEEIEKLKNITISKRGIVDVVFNLACICLTKRGVHDLKYICAYFNDKNTQILLKERNSLHIKNMLFLSNYFQGYALLLYFKITSFIKYYLLKMC